MNNSTCPVTIVASEQQTYEIEIIILLWNELLQDKIINLIPSLVPVEPELFKQEMKAIVKPNDLSFMYEFCMTQTFQQMVYCYKNECL